MSTDLDKLLLNAPLDSIIATTLEGKVLPGSGGAKPVFGYSCDEAVRRERRLWRRF
jgi:hypothetical protein